MALRQQNYKSSELSVMWLWRCSYTFVPFWNNIVLFHINSVHVQFEDQHPEGIVFWQPAVVTVCVCVSLYQILCLQDTVL